MGMNSADAVGILSWSDDVFAAWLAGYFDGEGSVHLPAVGIDVSIASTDRPVIEAIFRRLDIGTIQQVTFDQPGWNTKYHWRVRNYPHAERLLRLMLPYLTIKAEAARRALVAIDERQGSRRAKRERNEEILRLVAAGVRRREIADRFGVSISYVGWLVKYPLVDDPTKPKKNTDRSVLRLAHQRHIKQPLHQLSPPDPESR